MSKAKILYVDDEVLNLELFSIIFQDEYEIETANSAAEAFKCLMNTSFDVVISDMKMPGMTGLEFISNAKQKYRNIKFFLLTGYDISATIREAINNNLIVQHLTKPLDENEIRIALSKVI